MPNPAALDAAVTGRVLIVWQFRVRPQQAAAFERLYDSHGLWATFFQRSPDCDGVLLLRGTMPDTYMTIDVWRSRRAYEAFIQTHAAEYAQIDALGAQLTLSEDQVGIFETISS